MKKIIFSYLHYMGWGDSLISLFDIINCAEYIKTNHSDIEITLVVNDCSSKNISDIFPQVFDINFFNSFFDKFIIQEKQFHQFTTNNKCELDNISYNRVYSGRNYDMTPNVPGIFDVFVNDDFNEEFKTLDIPFTKFTFNDDGSSIIKDFPIFNKNVLDIVDEYINKELVNGFKSIHYRISDTPSPNNFEKLQEIKKILKDKLSQEDTHFLLTNHGIPKKELMSVIPNHKDEMINGYNMSNRTVISDPVISMVELLIISRGDYIYTYGDYPWISYFTFYARNVKRVKHKFIEGL